jgi:hypothetical protein
LKGIEDLRQNKRVTKQLFASTEQPSAAPNTNTNSGGPRSSEVCENKNTSFPVFLISVRVAAINSPPLLLLLLRRLPLQRFIGLILSLFLQIL